ncbi:MAG: hypothetical protein RLN62_02740 [Rickettsiales bacterium]
MNKITVLPDRECPKLIELLLFNREPGSWHKIEKMIDEGTIPAWTFSLLYTFPMKIVEKLLEHEELHPYFTNKAKQYHDREDIIALLKSKSIVDEFVYPTKEELQMRLGDNGNFENVDVQAIGSRSFATHTYGNFTNIFGGEGRIFNLKLQIKENLNISAGVLHLDTAEILCKGNLFVNVSRIECDSSSKITAFMKDASPIYIRPDTEVVGDCVLKGEIEFFDFDNF